MLSEHERNYGLGMDALLKVCSRNTNGIMVWAWMLWSPYALPTRTEVWFGSPYALPTRTDVWFGSPYALPTRTEVWFGHGCSGHRMLSEHERNYGLGMDALVTVCSSNTNGSMVWAWMLWSPYAFGTRTELWFGHVSQHQGVHGFARSRGSVRRLMGFGGSRGSRVRRAAGLRGCRWFAGSRVRGVRGVRRARGFASSRTRVRGFAGSRVRGFAGLRVRGFAGSRVRGFAGFAGFAGSRVRGFAGSRVRGFAGSRVRGFARFARIPRAIMFMSGI